MDQLETQVSDLRSFLGAAAAPQGQGRPDAAGDDVLSVASASVASAHDVAYSPGPPAPLRASSHHSSRSAPGDNSAPHHHYHHPGGPQSPLVDLRDGHGHAHSTSSSPGTLANSNAAKRRAADDEEDDGPARQQRSKRNRVRFLPVTSCSCVAILCCLSPVTCHLSQSLSLSPRLTQCVCSVVHLDCMVSSRLLPSVPLPQPVRPTATASPSHCHSQPVPCDGGCLHCVCMAPFPGRLPSPSLPLPSLQLCFRPTDGSRQRADKTNPNPFPPPPPAATSASDERSSAMARPPASGAATSTCSASTPRTAAPTSRTRTNSAT